MDALSDNGSAGVAAGRELAASHSWDTAAARHVELYRRTTMPPRTGRGGIEATC